MVISYRRCNSEWHRPATTIWIHSWTQKRLNESLHSSKRHSRSKKSLSCGRSLTSILSWVEHSKRSLCQQIDWRLLMLIFQRHANGRKRSTLIRWMHSKTSSANRGTALLVVSQTIRPTTCLASQTLRLSLPRRPVSWSRSTRAVISAHVTRKNEARCTSLNTESKCLCSLHSNRQPRRPLPTQKKQSTPILTSDAIGRKI